MKVVKNQIYSEKDIEKFEKLLNNAGYKEGVIKIENGELIFKPEGHPGRIVYQVQVQ